jgi:HEAT repeat protein
MNNKKIPSFLLVLLAIAAAPLIVGGWTQDRPAQTTPSPLDDILKRLLTFDTGLKSESYWKLRSFVRKAMTDPEAKADCEARLLSFLRSAGTVEAKMAVCRELRFVASERALPALGSLLFDPALSDPARFVLEKIPGEAADKTLLGAIDKATGTLKTGIISSLGARKSVQAVPALAKYLDSAAIEDVKAATMALGSVGGKDAAAVLSKRFPALRGDFKTAAASALLDCAEDLLKEKDLAGAGAIYDLVLAAEAEPSLRGAAMSGKIAAAADRAPGLVLETLRSADLVLHEAAIARIKDVFPPERIGEAASLLAGLPEESQIKLLAVLGDYPVDPSREAIRKAATGESAAVRTAALKALGRAGAAADVALLAVRAAEARGEEQSAVRTSLALLKGRAVDEAVAAALAAESRDDVKSELILAVGERRMFAAKSALIRETASPAEKIRIQAVKTLRIVGTPSDIPALLGLLTETGSEAEREEVENTVAALAQKISQPEGRSNPVKARLAAEQDPVRRAGLIRVLGKIGDDGSLPLIRKALGESVPGIVDAAVRALAGWPNAAPIEDVRELARTSADETQKLLALRGFIRMAGLSKGRRPEIAVADFKLAAEMSRRPDEKILILAALPDFASPEALALAQELARDPAVKAEAQAASDRIKKRLGASK